MPKHQDVAPGNMLGLWRPKAPKSFGTQTHHKSQVTQHKIDSSEKFTADLIVWQMDGKAQDVGLSLLEVRSEDLPAELQHCLKSSRTILCLALPGDHLKDICWQSKAPLAKMM